MRLKAYSVRGSFRFHAVAACAVLAVLAWVKPPAVWWAVIVLTVMLVLAAELINTAMENLASQPDHTVSLRTEIAALEAGAVPS